MANGLGPYWFPAIWRQWLTAMSKLFFEEAAWDRHDHGYAAGHPARSICDRKFFQAMLRDASRTTTICRVWACLCLAVFYWLMVRLFGWFSYNRKGRG